jgi:hypothetical protein
MPIILHLVINYFDLHYLYTIYVMPKNKNKLKIQK